MLEPLLRPGDEILVTGMEHHSNFLPWQQLAKRSGAAFRVAPVDASGRLDTERFMAMVNSHTRVAALSQRSNLTGIAPPAEDSGFSKGIVPFTGRFSKLPDSLDAIHFSYGIS